MADTVPTPDWDNKGLPEADAELDCVEEAVGLIELELVDDGDDDEEAE